MGIIAALLSAIFSTSKDVLSKALASRIDSTLSTFTSFAFALPYYAVVLTVLWFIGLETFTVGAGFFLWIILRSLSDGMAEWSKMKSFSTGDLSLVSSFLSLSPLFLLITSPLVTGDPLSAAEVISVILVVLGTLVIVYRPWRDHERAQRVAIAYALCAAVCFSLNTCFDRLAVQTSSPTLAAFWVTLLAGLMFVPAMLSRRGTLRQIAGCEKPLALRGFFEIAFMVSKLYALGVLPAPTVVAIQRVSLIFSIVSGKVVFNEGDFLRRLCGGALIVSGAVVILAAQII